MSCSQAIPVHLRAKRSVAGPCAGRQGAGVGGEEDEDEREQEEEKEEDEMEKEEENG